MFEEIKNKLVAKGGVATLVGLALAGYLLTLVVAEIKGYSFIGKNPDYQNTISVSGKGEEIAKPDTAIITFSVIEEESTVALAQELATAKMNKVFAGLVGGDIGLNRETDIKTTTYNISPRYEYLRDGATIPYDYYAPGVRTLVGYTVTNSVEVKVRDLAKNSDKVGKILTLLGKANVSNISDVNFTIDEYDALVKVVRTEAIADARAEAEKLASALGVKLGRLISYNDNSYAPYYGYAKSMSAGYGGDMQVESAPEIATGEQKITTSVNLIYEIL